mgnify:FL=1
MRNSNVILWKPAVFKVSGMGVKKGTKARVCRNPWWEKDGALVPNFCVLLPDRVLYLRQEALKYYLAPKSTETRESEKLVELLRTIRKRVRKARGE